MESVGYMLIWGHRVIVKTLVDTEDGEWISYETRDKVLLMYLIHVFTQKNSKDNKKGKRS